jgi:alpha-N-arabinofuranosidase
VIGKEYILVNGGTDISKKPVWIEGPHIFKIKGNYFLIAAQGGTGYDHSEVVFKSKKVYGPYVPYKNNPILTQRNLNPEREYPITSTGHADLVQTISGDWWAVFLGCRPYAPFDQDFYNTGRETFLAPVRWIKGWPVITSDSQKVQYYYPYPVRDSYKNIQTNYSGNISFTDNFDSDTLNLDWEFLRTPKEKWYSLKKKKGFLEMDLRAETCSEKVNPSFLGHRQQNLNCSASVSMDFIPENENEKAGLLIFQNETHYYFLCRSLENTKPFIQLYKSTDTNKIELLASKEINTNDSTSYLKIEAEGNKYSFSYSLIPNSWILLKDSVDAEFLSTKAAGGFVGCMFALYATSLGHETYNKAYFDWFKYFGKDEVYK